MSSILTNNSAQVALETLRNINRNLQDVQSEISTGKKVATAKDNAAIFAISTIIDTDRASFQQITDSLNLGSSTVNVARSASEQIVGEVQEIRDLIISAQESNVDRASIQRDVAERVEQIGSIVNSAQLNGLNLINGVSSEDVQILSSLNRSASGVSASFIDVARQDLSTTGAASSATFGDGTGITDASLISLDAAATNGTAAASAAATRTISIESVADGDSFRIVLDDSATTNSIGQRTFEFVASADDSQASVAANLANQIDTFFAATGETNFSVSRSGADITINNTTGANLSINAVSEANGVAAASSGGLSALNTINVETDAGATSALTAIEGVLQTAIESAAAFGSSQARLESQTEFVKSLTDSLTSGVGALRDADIEAASARLQALQVQQQLGTQALSIANQQPQQLLALFR
ncbi:MAG: flagellin [Pseudomonadota bacterium]